MARRTLRNLLIQSEKCNRVCKNTFFYTFFEFPHCNAKRNSHSSGISKRQEISSEMCQFSLKSAIAYLRPIIFRQSSKFLTAMQSWFYHHLDIPKARRKLRILLIQSEKYNKVCKNIFFFTFFEVPHYNAKRNSHSSGSSKGKKED